MRRLFVLPVWLALALTLCAAAPVKIVGPDKAAPYTLVELQAEGDLAGAAVLWDVSPDDLADVRELPNGKMIFTGPPGVYKVRCTVVRLKDGQTIADRQRFVVTIGTPPPPDPPPQPPPDPSDPLTKSLKAAWAQETDPSRAGQVAFLASIYKACGAGVLVDDPAVKTNADLLAALRDAIHKPGVGISEMALMKVRPAIAEYLIGELGKSANAPLDRTKAKAAMAKIGASLETLR